MVKVCNTSVCVECSLRDECLRCYAFCKHSKSPIFNRSMRVLNRLPIYLGEDLCDKINRDAVIKDIVGFNKKELKSVEYTPTYPFLILGFKIVFIKLYSCHFLFQLKLLN